VNVGEEARRSLFNTNLSNAENRKAASRGVQDQIAISALGYNSFQKAIGAVGSLPGTAQYLNGALGTLGRTIKVTEGGYPAMRAEAERQQKIQANSTAASLAQTQKNFSLFGNTLTGFMAKVFGPISDILVGWGDSISSWLSDKDGVVNDAFVRVTNFVTENIMPVMDNVAKWFTSTFKTLGATKTSEEFWKTLGDKLKEGFKNIWEFVKPTIVSMFKELFSAMKDALKAVLVGDTVTKENKLNYEKQNEANKAVMTVGERVSTFFAEFLEGAASKIFSREFGESMAAGRISRDMEAGTKLNRFAPGQIMPLNASPEGKASGGPISPGTYLVGEKGPELISMGSSGDVITNENITALLQRLEKVGQGNISAASIETLNTTMREVLKYVKDTAENSKRNVDATRALNSNGFPTP
jgi:hypothetical protein